MMRVFLCEHCKRWQYISDRLHAECAACSEPMFATDFLFTDFVDLAIEQRAELFCTISEEMNDKEKHEALRFAASKMLGRTLAGNKALCADCGYDY